MWRLHPRGEYYSRICYEPDKMCGLFPFLGSIVCGSEPAFKTSPTDKECVKGSLLRCDATIPARYL